MYLVMRTIANLSSAKMVSLAQRKSLLMNKHDKYATEYIMHDYSRVESINLRCRLIITACMNAKSNSDMSFCDFMLTLQYLK